MPTFLVLIATFLSAAISFSSSGKLQFTVVNPSSDINLAILTIVAMHPTSPTRPILSHILGLLPTYRIPVPTLSPFTEWFLTWFNSDFKPYFLA